MPTRESLIEAEAKRRCLAGGYSLDLPAKALSTFPHREGPLWRAFADKIEGEIERIEEAGFEVTAPRPDARLCFFLAGCAAGVAFAAAWLMK